MGTLKVMLKGAAIGGGSALAFFLAIIAAVKAARWLIEMFGPDVTVLLGGVAVFSFVGAIVAFLWAD